MFKLWTSYRAEDLEVIVDFINGSAQLQGECLERIKLAAAGSSTVQWKPQKSSSDR